MSKVVVSSQRSGVRGMLYLIHNFYFTEKPKAFPKMLGKVQCTFPSHLLTQKGRVEI